MRACRSGHKIGPFYADTPDTARALLDHAGHLADGAPVSIDVPANSLFLADHCRALGFENDFSTARMYRGPAPKADPSIFAVATLELG